MSGSRPRVLWSSPLPPAPSGVAAYSDRLLRRLAADLDLTVTGDALAHAGEYLALGIRCVAPGEFPALNARQPHDMAVYHLGNNPLHLPMVEALRQLPGVVVMHDSGFHHFAAGRLFPENRLGEYVRLLRRWHGSSGEREARVLLAAAAEGRWDEVHERFFARSLAEEVLSGALRVVVHNDFAARVAEEACAAPVERIEMHFDDAEPYLKRGSVSPTEFGAPPGTPLLTSFGHVSTHKRLDRVLSALARLNAKGIKFHFAVAGRVSPELPYRIEELAARHGLSERVTVLGYLDDSAMFRLFAASDLAVNLRYPTAGESSASLLRYLGAGVPVLVTNHGPSAEFPDDAVEKIPHDEREVGCLADSLERLLGGRDARESLALRGRRLARGRHSIAVAARRYLEVVEAARKDASRMLVGRAFVLLRATATSPLIPETRRAVESAIAERWRFPGFPVAPPVIGAASFRAPGRAGSIERSILVLRSGEGFDDAEIAARIAVRWLRERGHSGSVRIVRSVEPPVTGRLFILRGERPPSLAVLDRLDRALGTGVMFAHARVRSSPPLFAALEDGLTAWVARAAGAPSLAANAWALAPGAWRRLGGAGNEADWQVKLESALGADGLPTREVSGRDPDAPAPHPLPDPELLWLRLRDAWRACQACVNSKGTNLTGGS